MLPGVRPSISFASSPMARTCFLALIDTETGFDAVVLDASHLGESGTSLALYAKAHRLPVVMMSGTKSAMVFAEQHGLQLLRRPFRPKQLDAALSKVMGSGIYGRT